ncbi:hypothetical protein GGI22_001162 [Coemansia erecta]|nr:hypothetical protein GGI22_001162 [Coemansia erecta]
MNLKLSNRVALLPIIALFASLGSARMQPIANAIDNPLYASNSPDGSYLDPTAAGLAVNGPSIQENSDVSSAWAPKEKSPYSTIPPADTATVTVFREIPVWTDADGHKPSPWFDTDAPDPGVANNTVETSLPAPVNTATMTSQRLFVTTATAEPPAANTQPTQVQEAAQTVTITTTQVSTVTSAVGVPTTTTIVSTITQDVTQTVTQPAASMQQPNIQMIMNQPSSNVMTVTVTKTEQPAMPQYMPYMQQAPFVFYIGQGSGGDGQAFQHTIGQQAATDTTLPAVHPKPLEERLPISSAPPTVDQMTTAMTTVPASEPSTTEMPTSELSIEEMPTSEPDESTRWVTVVQTIDTTSIALVTVGN